MSYILDALNKSEQERARKRAPGLAALNGEQDRHSFTLKHFLIILLILVVVNFVGLYLMFGDRFTPEAVPGAEPEPAPEAGPTRQEKALNEEPEVITPATLSTKPSPKQSGDAQSRAQAVSFNYEPVAIDELPRAIQMRLPTVEITTHIYASDAELRMVKIDGEARYEGDILATDFRLLEITESGVVLEFEGYAYVFDIIEDWLE